MGKWPWRQHQFLYCGMTTLHLPLDRSSGLPIHRQIYDGLRRAILEGRLSPGQRVPSTRALAEDLAVSRLPVLTAYDQLLHEGYLEGRTGSGTFVSGSIPDDLLTPPEPAVLGASSRGMPRRAPTARPRDDGGLGPFRMSLPALDRFPHDAWARLVARRARLLSPADMAYGDPAGVVPLRAAVAEHLRAARAVRCEVEQVLIVSGSQAAARLAATVLLGPGDRVAMEEPGSPLIRAALGAEGAYVVPIPVDEDGLDVAALQRHAGPVRAAYVTPSHHYPLGASMTAGRRLALLDWAHREGAWLLEDDYDSEYRYVSRPLGALQGMDAHDRVIYIGTFSKVLFPAIRVGYLVVPPALCQRFVDARETFDLFSPTLYQLVLADFLREGHFARHLRRMRGVYRARRDALLTGLARHCGGRLTVFNADAGLHVAALLNDGLDDGDVVRRMAARGLTATPLSTCYAGADARSGLLLGFGGSPERRLLEATRVLGQILDEAATGRRAS
jgi:GntR family transcriptional regulator/MocR family aminotransferase